MNSSLQKVSLTGLELSETLFANTTFKETQLSQCQLYKSVLYDLDCRELTLNCCQLKHIVWAKSNLSGSHFEELDLSLCVFTECDLSFASFRKSQLAQASFKGANLSHANFDGVQAPYGIFVEAHGTELSARSAQFRQAVFVEASFEKANFEHSDLAMSVWQKAGAVNSCFDHCDLEHADFSFSNLSGSTFAEAKLQQTRFHRALSDQPDLKKRAGALEKDEALFEAELWSEQHRQPSRISPNISALKRS